MKRSHFSIAVLVILLAVSACGGPGDESLFDPTMTVAPQVEDEVSPAEDTSEEPESHSIAENLWAINYAGMEQSGPITIEIGRILVGNVAEIPLDFASLEWDTDVVGEIVFIVRNEGDSSVNVYPLAEGTLQIGQEPFELFEYFWMAPIGPDDVDGEILPGETKIGGAWFPIYGSQPGEITEIIFRTDFPADSNSYDQLGPGFEIVIPITDPGWEEYPEELAY